MNNLAELYRAQEHYEQAERFHKSAIKIWLDSVGPHHPSTLGGLRNYLGLMARQGKHAEAIAFLEEKPELKLTFQMLSRPETDGAE